MKSLKAVHKGQCWPRNRVCEETNSNSRRSGGVQGEKQHVTSLGLSCRRGDGVSVVGVMEPKCVCMAGICRCGELSQGFVKDALSFR